MGWEKESYGRWYEWLSEVQTGQGKMWGTDTRVVRQGVRNQTVSRWDGDDNDECQSAAAHASSSGMGLHIGV